MDHFPFQTWAPLLEWNWGEEEEEGVRKERSFVENCSLIIKALCYFFSLAAMYKTRGVHDTKFLNALLDKRPLPSLTVFSGLFWNLGFLRNHFISPRFSLKVNCLKILFGLIHLSVMVVWWTPLTHVFFYLGWNKRG